jgi:hypothetical protein
MIIVIIEKNIFEIDSGRRRRMFKVHEHEIMWKENRKQTT